MNWCDSFPLLSAPHYLFNIGTDLKRPEKIPGTPAWRWGEWIWLTGPSGLHRNSPQWLNISSIKVFHQIRDPEIPILLRPDDIQSMRNNLRQLPDLTFSRTLAGILRGWDLTIERNEELHLWQSLRALFLSVSATIFCENFVTNVGDMHGRLARWRKWRACDVGEAKEWLENELWLRWSNGRVGEWVVT